MSSKDELSQNKVFIDHRVAKNVLTYLLKRWLVIFCCLHEINVSFRLMMQRNVIARSLQFMHILSSVMPGTSVV